MNNMDEVFERVLTNNGFSFDFWFDIEESKIPTGLMTDPDLDVKGGTPHIDLPQGQVSLILDCKCQFVTSTDPSYSEEAHNLRSCDDGRITVGFRACSYGTTARMQNPSKFPDLYGDWVYEPEE